MENVYLTIVLAPLSGAIVAGFFGGRIGRAGAHWVTTLGVGVSTLLSLWVASRFIWHDEPVFNGTVYTWMVSDGMRLEVGFLVDRLTALMISVVTFVSLMVHVYTIGYMADDQHNWPKESLAGRNSYQRFFSYISLFTFSMLMLVMSNNFLQLFFGWEAVGLVSYLLIGFWSVRETAIFANLKAFLVNRVGDFGFILGIAAVGMYFNSMDYAEVFARAPGLAAEGAVLTARSALGISQDVQVDPEPEMLQPDLERRLHHVPQVAVRRLQDRQRVHPRQRLAGQRRVAHFAPLHDVVTYHKCRLVSTGGLTSPVWTAKRG